MWDQRRSVRRAAAPGGLQAGDAIDMSLKSLMNGVALATMVAATLMAAPSAEARDWKRGGHSEDYAGPGSGGGRHGGGNSGYVNRWGDLRDGSQAEGRGAFAHGRGQRWNGGYENSRGNDDSSRYGRDRDHTARNIAIGASAVFGLAIAAEPQRVHEDYYDGRD